MAARILIIDITKIQDQQIVEMQNDRSARYSALPGQSFPYKSTLGASVT
jgi:hypothetical protein